MTMPMQVKSSGGRFLATNAGSAGFDTSVQGLNRNQHFEQCDLQVSFLEPCAVQGEDSNLCVLSEASVDKRCLRQA